MRINTFGKICIHLQNQCHLRTDPMEVEVDQFETWELEAYAEGVNMPQIEQFVQQHPEFWEAWQHQHQKQEQTYSKLARFDCPSPTQLQRFYWQELSAEETTQLEHHLRQCASCREEMQSLVTFLDSESLESETSANTVPSLQGKIRSLLPTLNLNERIQEFGNRMRTIVAEMVPPLLPELAPVALRSDDPIPTLSTARPATMLFTVAESDVSLVAMREVDGSLFVSGQLLTPVVVEHGNVTLTPANLDQAKIEASMDSSGAFLINHLQPSYYFMRISFASQFVVIPNILLE